MTKIKIIITLAILLMFLTQPAYAVQVIWNWTAPTDGSQVDHYVIEVAIDNGEFIRIPATTTLTTINIEQQQNVTYVMRVAGVDIDGHQGCWSPVSEPDTYGAPGCSGKPWTE